MTKTTMVLALCLSGLACDDGESGDDKAAGTTGPSTTSGVTDTGVASSSGAADESSGAPAGPPQCTKACSFPGDCCPLGAEGCPSVNYPYAYSCIDNLCELAGCLEDAECGGPLSCLPVGAKGTCVQACAGDDDCAAISPDSKCTGVADGGQGYCFEPCQAIGDCGNSECDAVSGLCTCASSSQCIVGYECA